MTQDRQQPPAVGPIRGPEDFAAAFDVSRETIARLATYEALLRQWQKAVNLVAPSTLDAVWHRHFADSAQLLSLAPAARTWVDLGSGAGFPGLVVAILLAGRGITPTPDPSPQGGGEPREPSSPRHPDREQRPQVCLPARGRPADGDRGVSATRRRCGYPVDKNRNRGDSS